MINTCPFCDNEILDISKDHIFPEFLGGSAKIICCKECNNLFGHKFEAFVANETKATQGMIMSWGLKFKRKIPIWENAFSKENVSYNLHPNVNGRLTPKLSKPRFEKNDDGELNSVSFQTEQEALKYREKLIKSGKYKVCEIIQEEPIEIKDGDLGLTLVIGDELKRTALKMCIDLFVHFNDFNAKNLKTAKFYLYKEYLNLSVATAYASYINYSSLDSLRPGLSHLIYVEKNSNSTYGIVQFFGVVQIYCNLGEGVDKQNEAAYLGVLDPLNGRESFSSISKLNIKVPPDFINNDHYQSLLQGWLDKYKFEAIKCNATHPPNLQLAEIKID